MIPGSVFTYRRSGSFLRSRSGGGQVLGLDERSGVVFARLFDVGGQELRPFIEFLPMLARAFRASKPRMVRSLALPQGWAALNDEWEAKWRAGDAGIFSIPLGEIAERALQTVEGFRAFEAEEHAFIELAYPTRSQPSGAFDTIAAFVKTGG
jgi:hypothetical protein